MYFSIRLILKNDLRRKKKIEKIFFLLYKILYSFSKMGDIFSLFASKEIDEDHEQVIQELNDFNPLEYSRNHIPKEYKDYLTGIICGPSSSGKNTILSKLYEQCFKFHYDKFMINL